MSKNPINSMTAFARGSHETTYGLLTWECRGVNHRYLEMYLRLPEGLRQVESACREQIAVHCHRGKVEALLRFTPGQSLPYDIEINQALTDQLLSAVQALQEKSPQGQINLADILQMQGVLQTKDTHMDEVGEAAIKSLTTTLQDLQKARQREGEKLKQYLSERCQQILEHTKSVDAKMPEIIEALKNKLTDRFNEAQVELNQERLEQEMVMLAQKVDVAEELHRLTTHVEEIQRILNKGGVIGRRLDFLMQELNREANTLASKSIHAGVTQIAVELKVLIEQMREQVQNIE